MYYNSLLENNINISVVTVLQIPWQHVLQQSIKEHSMNTFVKTVYQRKTL